LAEVGREDLEIINYGKREGGREGELQTRKETQLGGLKECTSIYLSFYTLRNTLFTKSTSVFSECES